MEKRRWELNRDQITTLVACVILVSWTIGFAASLVIEDYELPTVLTPLMLVLAGFCFQDGITARRKKPAPEEADE